MGRLSLMLVLAAAIGGSILTLNTRLSVSEMTERQSEDQQDALAREIAEAGESLVLARMMGADGFIDPTTNGISGAVDYADGEFEVAIDAFSPMEVTFTVTGRYGGARHAVQSTYEFDPMDAPGPLWLDVPYATAAMSPDASISGSATSFPVHFDRRRHDDLEVESLVSLASLQSALGSAISGAGSALAVPAASEWIGDTGLLEDLNVNDADGLYQAAVSAMGASDRLFSSSKTEGGRAIWGTPSETDMVTRVAGDLTVTGHVSGHGALVVEGALRVPSGGRLSWNGIVIVRDQADVITIELDGDVDIVGSLVVSQEAFPPGGHLDVSTYHNPTESAPQGIISGRPTPVDQPGTRWSASHPWWQHSHAFDLTPRGAPRGDHVIYLSGGAAGRHENAVEFRRRLASIPADESVYLEFGNNQNHGFARYNIGLSSVSDPIRGSVRTGFQSFASSVSDHRSKSFRAGDLRDFDVDIYSLRSLRQSFDQAGASSSWPSLIGWDWGRREALAVRLVRESDGARLYESSLYWHMRQDEVAAHAIEEAAWRARILAGQEFGTRLRMGDDVNITYQRGPIALLSDKLGFDGNEVVLLSTAADHMTPSEKRSEMMTMGDAEEQDGGVVMCHNPGGRNARTMSLAVSAVAAHLRHGDSRGACPGDEASGRSGRSGRSEASGRSGRSGRSEASGRSGRSDRSGRSARSGRSEQSGRSAQSGRSDRR